MSHSAKSLFEKNIESSEKCMKLFDGLTQLQTPLDTTWLLRAAIVFSISALDAYFHDKIRYRAGKFDIHSLPPHLAKFQVPLGDLSRWEEARRKGNVLRNWVTSHYSKIPLQRKDDIAKALRLVGIDNLWASIESDSPARERLLAKLNDFVQRRNQIAHEGDRLPAKKHGKKLRDIDREYVATCIQFSRDMVQRIEHVYPVSGQVIFLTQEKALQGAPFPINSATQVTSSCCVCP